MSESAREAARSYRKRIEDSSDPLVSAMRGVGTTVGNAADSVFDWFNKRAWGGGVQDTTAPTDQPDPPAADPPPHPPEDETP